MKITFKNSVKQTKKFLQGGPVVAPIEELGTPAEVAPVEAAPAEGGQENPMMLLALIFAQGLLNQDCQMLAQGAQMFLQLVEQASGGGLAPLGEPVFAKNGAKLLYRIKN